MLVSQLFKVLLRGMVNDILTPINNSWEQVVCMKSSF